MTHVCPHCEAILLPDERICPICGEGKDAAPKPAEATPADPHAQAAHTMTPGDVIAATQTTRRSVFAPIGAAAAIAVCAALVFMVYQNGVRHPSGHVSKDGSTQSASVKSTSDSGQIPLLFSEHSTSDKATASSSGKSTQQTVGARGAAQPAGTTFNAVTTQPQPQSGQSQPTAPTDGAAPLPPQISGGGAPTQAAALPQTDPKQAALASMDSQLTDARSRITQMTDMRSQLNDRLQQLQANPPPDGAAIQRRQYDQEVQALQQQIDQAQTAIDSAQSAVDTMQQQRDRLNGQ